MAHPEITLTLNEGQGHTRQIAVESLRFTIGRSPDSDLEIDDPGLSRRHALIEKFEGVVLASDCGSENGTFVNGNRITSGVVLKDRDVILIGSACSIVVGIGNAMTENASKVAQDHAGRIEVDGGKSEAPAVWLTTPVIAFAAVALVLLVAAPLIAFLNGGKAARGERVSKSQQRQNENEGARAAAPARAEADRDARTSGDLPSKAITVEQVEKVAVQFMRRISSDDRPYVFPPYAVNALGDIRQRVEQYCASPALAPALQSIANGGPAIAAQARREGIEPGLVIYTALADSEGGQAGGDQMAVARRILPDLLSLRKTLGTESADKSLILVAAYKMGGGTKKSHPLLQTMRRVVKNPLSDRNVWFLREQGGLDNKAYDFVVSFLALGVIAENPRRFGVTAPPVSY